MRPSISSLAYDGDNRTLTCVYTGSPAITVSWEKNGVPFSIDGSNYHMTQTLTDRAHSIVLTVSEMAPAGVFGKYTCTVSNQTGTDHKSVEMISKYFVVSSK